MRLLYAITSCILLIIIVFCADNIQDLKRVNAEWNIDYQTLRTSYDNDTSSWELERSQWKDSVVSRDEIIQWYKDNPLIVTTTEVKEIEVPVVIEKIVEVENTIEVPIDTKPFNNLDELNQFMIQDNTDRLVILYSDKNGNINFTGICKETAYQLRDNAKRAGYDIETEILSREDAIKYQQYIDGNVYSLNYNDGHYINKAIIDNQVYFISPENDKVWLVYDDGD